MAVSKSLGKLANEQAEVDMTPMIDVTFLLLIFFMCTLHFKTLEGILQANLPKDVGISNSQVDKKPEEPINVKLLKATKNTTVIWVDDTQLDGQNKYQQLFQKIKNVTDRSPSADITVIIDPDIEVPFQDIISTLNACRRVDNVRPGQKPLQVKFAAKILDEDESSGS